MLSIAGSPKSLIVPAREQTSSELNPIAGLEEHHTNAVAFNLREPIANKLFALPGYRQTIQCEIDSGTTAAALFEDSQTVDLRQQVPHVQMAVFKQPTD